MSRNTKKTSHSSSLLALLLVAVTSDSQENEPFVQADVYDTLYEAQVQCDDSLDQSRSEFITEMFERYRRNSVSIELLRKLIRYNVQFAQRDIAEKTKERELYISELLDVPEESSAEGVDPAEASNDRYGNIRRTDEFLKEERRYVEVHECVLTVLEIVPER